MSELSLFEEIPVVTIAAKSTENLLNSSGTVYVITEEDIRRYGWRDLKEILAAVPNIDMMWQWNWLNGGQRGFTGNFAGTLLLIDGREVQNLLASEAFITNAFPSHRIKRIEILQGPNSTLYGGNAVQGVINIITKHGDEGDRNITEIQAIGGDVGTEQIAGTFKKVADDFELGFSASYYKSDQNWDELARFAADTGKFSRDAGRDPLRYLGTEEFKNDEQSWTMDSYIRYKGFYGGSNYFETISKGGMEYVTYDYSGENSRRGYRQVFLGYKHEFSDSMDGFVEYRNMSETERWVNQIYVSGTGYDDIVLDVQGETLEETTKNLITTQVNYRPNDTHFIIAGYEFWRLHLDDFLIDQGSMFPNSGLENLSPSWPTDKQDTDKHSVFVQDTIKIIEDKLKLTLGLRFNHQDYTNDSWLPRGSLVWMFTQQDALKFTYGKAFRPPNIFEFVGSTNDDLDSQEMEMYEINYTAHRNWDGLTLSNICAAYRMEASNLYNKVMNPDASVETAGGNLNIWRTEISGSFTVYGVEDFARLNWRGFSCFAGFRWVRPDESEIGNDEIIADVPETKVKLGLSYDFLEWLTASVFIDHWASVKTEANSLDGLSTVIYEVPAFTVLNLNVNIGEFDCGSSGGKMLFSCYVENLLDEEYYHANVRGTSPVQYLQAPRNVRLQASFRF